MENTVIAASPLDIPVIHHDTLWMRCFWVVAKRNSDEGREVIKFCDVDDLVLEKAKLPFSELQSWMMDNAPHEGPAACGRSRLSAGLEGGR